MAARKSLTPDNVVGILNEMKREGAGSAEDLEIVQIALRSNDPAATVIGILSNKTSTFQMAAAGAFAIEAGALIEAVHELDVPSLFSTTAGDVGFGGVTLLAAASAVGIYQFGKRAWKSNSRMQAILRAVGRLRR